MNTTGEVHFLILVSFLQLSRLFEQHDMMNGLTKELVHRRADPVRNELLILKYLDEMMIIL